MLLKVYSLHEHCFALEMHTFLTRVTFTKMIFKYFFHICLMLEEHFYMVSKIWYLGYVIILRLSSPSNNVLFDFINKEKVKTLK